jgi:hypothetical protein
MIAAQLVLLGLRLLLVCDPDDFASFRSSDRLQTTGRTAAAHGVISSVFNAALLALTVNIAASAI